MDDNPGIGFEGNGEVGTSTLNLEGSEEFKGLYGGGIEDDE